MKYIYIYILFDENIFLLFRLNICDNENCSCKIKSAFQQLKYDKFEEDIILRHRKYIRNCYAPNMKMRLSMPRPYSSGMKSKPVRSSTTSTVMCSHQSSDIFPEVSKHVSNRRCSCCQRNLL